MTVKTEEFRKYAHQLVDWMAEYFDEVENLPVTPEMKPGDIYQKIPEVAPDQSESFEKIFTDFKEKIFTGMSHWQSPNWFAYFPANSSKPSVLAEMLTATMGTQGMIWLTSPAATELEERMMEWLRQMIGLPPRFTGVIQDTASTATLVALLTAREKITGWKINRKGFSKQPFTIYCSTQAHSSIDKAVKIAGFGEENLRKIPVDEDFSLIPNLLEDAIQKDMKAGKKPLVVISALGTTSSTAIDPVRTIGEICQKYGLWHHIDAAFAGTALLLPEKRWMNDGAELADSFVFNPHKWMLVNFDCSAYFVKDPKALVRTFSITPEYLKTSQDQVVKNYREWGIPLGRRFRALKLWFVIRSYGVEGIQKMLRHHLKMARWFEQQIDTAEDFKKLAPVVLNTICFRYQPPHIEQEHILNSLNQMLIEKLNETRRVLFTQTKLDDKFTIRMVIGQTEVQERHVETAWQLIQETARSLAIEN